MMCSARLRSCRLVALGTLLILAPGCERKAPSPDECLDYAMSILRFNDQRLLVAEDKDRVDSLVVKCLTTPFDKELLACTKRRRGSSSCLLEFGERERKRNSPRE